MTHDAFTRSLAISEAIFAAVERTRDRDGTLRRREAAEGEACQPGPCEDTASPNYRNSPHEQSD